jgi:hypothetical protein
MIRINLFPKAPTPLPSLNLVLPIVERIRNICPNFTPAYLNTDESNQLCSLLNQLAHTIGYQPQTKEYRAQMQQLAATPDDLISLYSLKRAYIVHQHPVWPTNYQDYHFSNSLCEYAQNSCALFQELMQKITDRTHPVNIDELKELMQNFDEPYTQFEPNFIQEFTHKFAEASALFFIKVRTLDITLKEISKKIALATKSAMLTAQRNKITRLFIHQLNKLNGLLPQDTCFLFRPHHLDRHICHPYSLDNQLYTKTCEAFSKLRQEIQKSFTTQNLVQIIQQCQVCQISNFPEVIECLKALTKACQDRQQYNRTYELFYVALRSCRQKYPAAQKNENNLFTMKILEIDITMNDIEETEHIKDFIDSLNPLKIAYQQLSDEEKQNIIAYLNNDKTIKLSKKEQLFCDQLSHAPHLETFCPNVYHTICHYL